MRKDCSVLCMVVLLLAASSVTAPACTIGVANGSVTEDDRPLLWKSRMWSGSPNNRVACYDGGLYHYIGIGSLGQSYAMMGVNEAGLSTGNTLVGDGENATLMNYALGNFSTVDQVEAYIQQQHDANVLQASGCFPFMDATGRAVIFEIDHSSLLIEYDSADPDRAAQDMLGWVVRANEFHNRPDGTDNTSITGRYLSGAYNTYGLVQEGRLSADTIVQGDNGTSGYEFMRYGPSRLLTTIAQPSVCSSMVVQGVLPDEDPALSTMWAMVGQANYSIAVPTWVGVVDVPGCLNDGNMAARANSLYAKAQEVQTQASIFPMEAHVLAETDALLDHWRSDGTPSVDEMTRVEQQMADDAYSLLNCLDLLQADNRAPNVVIEAATDHGLALDFTTSVTDVDGSVASFEWDFGDGQTSNDISPRHTYDQPGWYLVSCTVTDDDGVSNTDWQHYYVDYLPTTLTLSIVNESWGSVTVDPNLPEYADPNTVVTLTAVPIEGKAFRHWEVYDPCHPGDANYREIEANNPLILTMDLDREVTAVFKCGSGIDAVLPLLMLATVACIVTSRRLPPRSPSIRA